MENQHRKIKGYRELSQAEIDLMNEIKQKGVELEQLCAKVKQHITAQTSATADGANPEEADRLTPGKSMRLLLEDWLSQRRRRYLCGHRVDNVGKDEKVAHPACIAAKSGAKQLNNRKGKEACEESK